MPAMKRILATSLTLSLLLSTVGSTKALQPPDFRAVDLLPGSGSSNAFVLLSLEWLGLLCNERD